MPTLLEQPDQILKLIIKFSSISDQANIARLSKRFNELIKPKLNEKEKLELHEEILEAICTPNQIQKIKELLRKGASTGPNPLFNILYRSTLILHVAALANNVEAIKIFLRKNDVHVDQKEDTYTALHWAAFAGNAEAAKVLIDHGATITLETKNGYTPADIAKHNGHKELANAIRSNSGWDKIVSEKYTIKKVKGC